MRLLIAALLIATSAAPPALAQEPDPARAARWMDNLMWGRGHVGGPFELLDQNGNRRTDGDFRGKLLVVYFGYTYCPDICPTDLTEIGLAVDRLGELGNDVQPLFITLDPERNTPKVLARYVPMFHLRLVGLTETPKQIRAVTDSYMADYAKHVPTDGGVYLIDHTGLIYLMGRSGEYLGFFPPGTSADRMVEMIRQRLSQHQ